MSAIMVTKREFKWGARTLVDLNPSLSAEESLQLYEQDYPELVNSKLEGPQIIEGVQVYTVTTSYGYKG